MAMTDTVAEDWATRVMKVPKAKAIRKDCDENRTKSCT
jgi:hypothetical protein